MIKRNSKSKKLQQTGANRRKTNKALQISESRYRRLFETARDGILLLDAKTGEIFDVNPFLLEILGYSRKEFLGKHLWDMGFFEDAVASKSAFLELQKKGHVRYEDLPLKTKDGRRIEVEFVSNVYWADGKKVIQCNIRNITKRKKTEMEFAWLASFPERNPNPIVEADLKGHVCYLNPAARKLLPKLEQKELGHPWMADWQAVVQAFRKGKSKTNIRELVIGNNLYEQAMYYLTESGCIRIYGRDITERRQMEEEIRALSLTDDLTNLYNRRGFFTLAEQQLYIARRAKRAMFLIYADLDNMKWINDKFGHQEGDLALVNVADIIKKTFRESDIVTRIGGDEFVILATETAAESKETLVKRLQENLKVHNLRKNRKYELSLSMGVVFCDPQQPHPCSLDHLIAQADKLMYKEKRAKRKM